MDIVPDCQIGGRGGGGKIVYKSSGGVKTSVLTNLRFSGIVSIFTHNRGKEPPMGNAAPAKTDRLGIAR